MKILIQYPNVEILERAFECTPEEVEKLKNMGNHELTLFIKEKISSSDLPSYEQMTGTHLIFGMLDSGIGKRPRVQEAAQ